MKIKNSPQGFKLRGGSAALLLATGCLLSAGISHASTIAGTVLTNSVTVDYDDAGGNAQTQITASVDVTVDHQASVAWQTTAPTGETTGSGSALPANPDVGYAITLTNTGNGSDTYSIVDNTPGAGSCTTGTLGAESFALSDSAPVLGATVASAFSAIGATTITTPDDSNTADSISRDIAVGNFIVTNPGGDVVEVTGVSENDAGSGNTVITFTPALVAAVNIGDQVGEQVTITYGATGVAGVASGDATGCTHDHELVVTGSTETGGNTAATDTINGFSTTVEAAATLTVAKYVRNNTDTGKNTGVAAITYAGVTYYSTGQVTANPGQILEYLVVITNGSTGDATDVVFNDTLPAFTTYQTGSNAVDTDGADGGTPGTGEAFEVNGEAEADNGGGIVTQSGSTIQVFPGTGGNEDTDLGGGITDVSSAPNNKSAVRYQVQVQ